MRFILDNPYLDELRRTHEEWEKRPESRQWYEAKEQGSEDCLAPRVAEHWSANIRLDVKSIAAKTLLAGMPVCLWQLSTEIETLALFALLPVLLTLGI